MENLERRRQPAVRARNFGLLAFLAGIAAVALDHFVGDPSPDIGEYLVLVAIVAAITLLVFGLVVLRGLRRLAEGKPAKIAALSTAIVGLLAIVVFWSGTPVVVGFAGGVLGYEGRSNREGMYRAALVVGALAFVGGWAVTALNLTGLDIF